MWREREEGESGGEDAKVATARKKVNKMNGISNSYRKEELEEYFPQWQARRLSSV